MAYLKIRVSAGSRRQGLAGWQGDILRVKVQTAPERGKANEAVLRLLAECLSVPVSSVTLRRGETSRDKLLFVDGLGDEELRARLSGTA